ncbi:MAG TPA: hypothetical protein VFN09_08980 [Rhodanobacteraceae bacterium]|nr:hypothetical protein [Rhodanobacteraceae bacterium]
MQRRARLIFGIAAAVVIALLLVAWLARSLLAPERFTALLTQAVADQGLTLELAAPAQPAVWPRPAVVLDGLRLSLPGGGDTVLAADELRLVLPWSAISGRQLRIGWLELSRPRFDLAALRRWLATRPASHGQSVLPRIEAGVVVHDGVVASADALLLDRLELSTGRLESGQSFRLQSSARDNRARPLALTLQARPQLDSGINLDSLQIHFTAGRDAALALTGQLRWSADATLSGALVGTARLAQQHYELRLGIESLQAMNLALDGDKAKLALSLSPQQAWQWWQTASDTIAGIALPPVNGQLSVDDVAVAGWHISGLHVASGAAAIEVARASSAAVAPARSAP